MRLFSAARYLQRRTLQLTCASSSTALLLRSRTKSTTSSCTGTTQTITTSTTASQQFLRYSSIFGRSRLHIVSQPIRLQQSNHRQLCAAAAAVAAMTAAAASALVGHHTSRNAKSDLQAKENETNNLMTNHKNSSSFPMASAIFNTNRVHCSSLFHTQEEIPTVNASFQLMAALESKDEVQRVRLAQILHDLHELAQQQQQQTKKQSQDEKSVDSKLQRKGTLGRLWRIAKQPFQSRQRKQQQEIPPMSRHDFGNMTPERADILIHEIVHNGEIFEPACLRSLLHIASSALREEDTLLDLRGVADKICIVGDLHGSLSSLNYVLQQLKSEIGTSTAIVFDGDFVDRGRHSVEVICVLLVLKLAYPKHVFLLRGNHEDALVASAYGFQDEVQAKYGTDQLYSLWDSFNEVFCALPIAAVTETAAILHGGLPSDSFTLDDIKSVSVEERCQITSTIEPSSKAGRLVQGILWSDPSTRNGIHPNTTRSLGVFFGPDTVAKFLKRHNLKYLIRGHEVAEKGVSVMDCGTDGKSVITVFSHSEYPNGEGSNMGAYLNLDKEGEYELVKFSRATKFFQGGHNKLNPNDPYVETLNSLIASKKCSLEKEFSSVAPDGCITALKWADVMAQSLMLPEIPWLALIPSLVPQSNNDMEHVDWRAFLQLYESTEGASSTSSRRRDSKRNGADINSEILDANHKMLLTVFKFLDMDGNGSVGLEEFQAGVALMNKRLPYDRQIKDPVEMFRKLDRDGNGYIGFEEFEKVFHLL